MDKDIVDVVMNVCEYNNVYLVSLLPTNSHCLMKLFENPILLLHLLLGHHTQYRWTYNMSVVQNLRGLLCCGVVSRYSVNCKASSLSEVLNDNQHHTGFDVTGWYLCCVEWWGQRRHCHHWKSRGS